MVLSLRHNDVASALTSRQWRPQAFAAPRGSNLIQILVDVVVVMLVIIYHVFFILLTQYPEEAVYVFLMNNGPPRGEIMRLLGNLFEWQFHEGLILGQYGRFVVEDKASQVAQCEGKKRRGFRHLYLIDHIEKGDMALLG